MDTPVMTDERRPCVQAPFVSACLPLREVPPSERRSERSAKHQLELERVHLAWCIRMADATVDAWLVARDHRSLGPLTRTLWALEAQKRQAAAEVALPAPPPEAQLVSAPLTRCAGRIGWLYAEHCVVVLIDARRHCLLQQVGSRLETLLGSLAAGPRLGESAAAIRA